MPQYYVVGNKYLVGHGEGARFKLSPEYARVAIDWLVDYEHDKAGTASAAFFVNDICLPAKTLEMWEAMMIKRFGSAAETFKPFQRVVQTLKRSGRGRILLCIRDRIQLGGKDATTGIGECRAVQDELTKMKAGTLKPDAEGTAPASSQGSCDAEMTADVLEKNGADGEYADLLTVDSDKTEDDPMKKRLHAEVARQQVHVAIHSDKDSFLADCRSRIVAEEKAIIYVEAPSSKTRILSDMITIASELPKASTAAVFVPVGSRLGLLSSAATYVKKWFPRRQLFTVAIGGDQQSSRSRTAFGVYVPVPSVKKDVPTALSSTGGRAKTSESVRLRCKNAACKWRTSAKDGEEGEDLDFQEVIPDDIPSDVEKDGADMTFEEDADDDAEDADEDRGRQADGSMKCLANLFPFAYPVALHHVVLNTLRAKGM